MSKPISALNFLHRPGKKLDLQKSKTEIPALYEDKSDYRKKLEDVKKQLVKFQGQIHAEGKHSVLVIFQAMDAAGKDSTIEHVFTGVDPQGIWVTCFKSPSSLELRHDFLWRSLMALPERGKIGVHNRSYYEEVLICKVHPNIVTKVQLLPPSFTEDLDKLYEERYESIRDFEKHLSRNGTKVIKFFLNVSKKEQAERLLDRIEEKDKNFKFEEGDLDQREYWSSYMRCYEDAIEKTSTEESPWYVIPADDKRTTRLLVAEAMVHELSKLGLAWPVLDEKQNAVLEVCRQRLRAELGEEA